jgi:hypothetical protein
MNEQIQKAMKALGLTEQEAREMLADDAKIDKGQKMAFDLTPEQEKNAKKARATGTKKPTAYKFENRKRKENPEKRDILKALFELAEDCWDNAELVNPERQVDFHLNGNHYSITLTCHRPPKEGKA